MANAGGSHRTSLGEIRAELLTAHQGLRELIDQVRRTVGHAWQNEVERAELRLRVGHLVQRLREHNLREEELLWPFVAGTDPSGQVRADAMNAEHVAEHTELCAAFIDANAMSDTGIARGALLGVLDGVAAHIAHEEEFFFA